MEQKRCPSHCQQPNVLKPELLASINWYIAVHIQQLYKPSLILLPSAERQGSPMEQDPFLKREELAQAHQLGALQQEYTIRCKSLLKFGTLLLIAFLIAM